MTTYTTRITASITAAAIEQAHDYMLTLASPAGTRFFGTEPNRTGANGDYLIVETVAHPTVADAYRQCADEIAASVSPRVCVSTTVPNTRCRRRI